MQTCDDDHARDRSSKLVIFKPSSAVTLSWKTTRYSPSRVLGESSDSSGATHTILTYTQKTSKPRLPSLTELALTLAIATSRTIPCTICMEPQCSTADLRIAELRKIRFSFLFMVVNFLARMRATINRIRNNSYALLWDECF